MKGHSKHAWTPADFTTPTNLPRLVATTLATLALAVATATPASAQTAGTGGQGSVHTLKATHSYRVTSERFRAGVAQYVQLVFHNRTGHRLRFRIDARPGGEHRFKVPAHRAQGQTYRIRSGGLTLTVHHAGHRIIRHRWVKW